MAAATAPTRFFEKPGTTSERRLRRGVEVGFGVVNENDGSIATMWRRKYVEHRLESGTAVL